VFPLDQHVNWSAVAKRVVQTLAGGLVIAYLFYQHVLPVCEASVPHFANRDYYNIMLSVLNVGIPCSYIWLTIFYLVFHAWTNFCAEITKFADRRFYSDWWNAGNLAEYWRKWNYPIHNWLVRHVYYPLIRRGVRSDIARFLTFLVSAVFHEYVVIGVFRIVNFMAFLIMIVNVPAMQLQAALKSKVSSNFNNTMFWLCYTVIGQPFTILLCYY